MNLLVPEIDIPAPSSGSLDCIRGGIDYVQVFVQRYLKRLGTAMHEESPLIRQWILLRTLAARPRRRLSDTSRAVC